MEPLSRLLRYRKLIAVKKLRDPHTPLAVFPPSGILDNNFNQSLSVFCTLAIITTKVSLFPIVHLSVIVYELPYSRSRKKLWSCKPPNFWSNYTSSNNFIFIVPFSSLNLQGNELITSSDRENYCNNSDRQN